MVVVRWIGWEMGGVVDSGLGGGGGGLCVGVGVGWGVGVVVGVRNTPYLKWIHCSHFDYFSNNESVEREMIRIGE